MVLLRDKDSNIESKFDMQRQIKTGKDFLKNLAVHHTINIFKIDSYSW
jgi:hypothetical protein